MRRPFESAYGTEFSGVRIHTGSTADESVRAHGARAYALGQSIFFRGDTYAPGTSDGQRLLGHELAHIAQQKNATKAQRSPEASTNLEQEAEVASARAASGGTADVGAAAPLDEALCFRSPEDLEDDLRGQRAYERTRYRRDVGGRRYTDWDRDSWRPGQGSGQTAPMTEADTEAKLQADVARLRPTIPHWTDAANMSDFDSSFWGQPGQFNFRGRIMASWEVNYYFVSMAMAHQGWDWNEAQTIIWAWNKTQQHAINPFFGGGGDMTDEMWFAAHEGFTDELERMGH